MATAKLFLEEGAKVVVVDIMKKGLEEFGFKPGQGKISYCKADVSNAGDTEKFINHTLKEFGRIDIFFANGVLRGPPNPLHTIPTKFLTGLSR